MTNASKTRRFAAASLPTNWGDFEIVVYRDGGEEAVALIGEIPERAARRGDPVLVRIHSACFTGEVLGSLRCDCRSQLDVALTRIAAEGGVLIYLLQEGRGIGLGNKIAAYALQDRGADTVEANLALGFGADDRSYEVAAAILDDLGVGSVRLMTNNPDKVAALASAGVEVVQEPHWVDADDTSRSYLDTKVAKLGHIAELAEAIKKAT